MNQAPPSGKLARGAIAAVALGQAGLARAGHQVRALTRSNQAQAEARVELDADLGRILFRAMNQLKGTALKLSQMLSSYADFLPPALRRELGAACYSVTPLNRALVHKVFRQEFGCAPEQLFASFDGQAFAAASLGQVHRATLADGMPVAVKVQYPGIASSIGSDLQMLRAMVRALGVRTERMPPPEVVDQVMDEIAFKLAEELDYVHEAAQLNWFREHAALPGIVIPQPILRHSSRRVLTMERLSGLHLDQWLATEPGQAARNHAGQLLFDWYLHSTFELGRLHADPHAGNFLFMDDGRLGLIDFGCTRTLTPGFSARLAATWNGLLAFAPGSSSEPVRLAYVALGYIDASLSQADFDADLVPAITPSTQWMVAPFRTASFDFGATAPFPLLDSENARTLRRNMCGMPPDAPYADRAYLGMVQMLKQLGATVSTKNRWISPSGGV